MLRFVQSLHLSLIAVALAVLLTACAFPQQGTDSIDDIEGTYYVNGTDARGVEYGGRLEITPGDRSDAYEMQWIITGSVQVGSGVRFGNRIDATWSTVEGLVDRDDAGLAHGTAVYTISSDGTLSGTRTIVGQSGSGTEEAFPVR